MDSNLFNNLKKIDLSSQPVKEWKERYGGKKPGTFRIEETKFGTKLKVITESGQVVFGWPRKRPDGIIDCGIYGAPSHVKEAVAEYLTDPKVFMAKVKECDATTVPGTMKPNEKPDINAEDQGMEDYSDDDMTKAKDKTTGTEMGLREVPDKELEYQKHAKESKIDEVRLTHEEKKNRYGVEVTVFKYGNEEVAQMLASHTSETIPYEVFSVVGNKHKRVEGIEDAEEWINRVIIPRLQTKESKRSHRGIGIREQLRFCNGCNKTFRSNEAKCKCGSDKTEPIGEREYSDMTSVDKFVFEVEYTLDGQKAKTRVVAFDEGDAKRAVEKTKRGSKAIGAKKISDESKVNEEGGLANKAGKKPEDFDKEQLEAGTKVETEHTDDPAKAQQIAMDHLTEDPQYYTKLKKMEAGKCEAKVPDDKDPEAVPVDETDSLIDNIYQYNESASESNRVTREQIDFVIKSLTHTDDSKHLMERMNDLRTLQKEFYGGMKRGDDTSGTFIHGIPEKKETGNPIYNKMLVILGEVSNPIVQIAKNVGFNITKGQIEHVLWAVANEDRNYMIVSSMCSDVGDSDNLEKQWAQPPATNVPNEAKVPDDKDPEATKIKKLIEGVTELVDEMDKITPEDRQAVRAAIDKGSIENDWPTDEAMINELSKLEDFVDPNDLEADFDTKMAYLKYVLAPKAISMTESKVNEKGWFYRAVDDLKADPKFQKLVKDNGANSDEVRDFVMRGEGNSTAGSIVDDLVKAATGQEVVEAKVSEELQTKMMPENPEEKKKREALVAAAAKAVDAWGEDELEVYAEQMKNRQQRGK
jgi:hypothetical protein